MLFKLLGFNPFRAKHLEPGMVEGMVIYHDYFVWNHILNSSCPENHFNGVKEPMRVVISCAQWIILWVITIKLQVCALIPDQRVQLYLSNPVILISRFQVATQALVFLGFIFASVGFYLWYHDYIIDAKFLNLYHKLQYYHTLELNTKNKAKFARMTKIFIALLMSSFLLGELGLSGMYFSEMVYINYLFHWDAYIGLATMAWMPFHIVAINYLCAIALSSVFYIFIVSYYLKLRFNQTDEILLSKDIKDDDRLLWMMVTEHDRCTRITLYINSWMKDIVFVYYYAIVPTVDLSLLILIYEHKLIYRIVVFSLVIVFGTVLAVANNLLSLIGREAHKCYPQLNSMLVRKRIRLGTRLKVLNLCERVSGPLIGIYCYDLFPFTNNEFQIFVVNCVSNFILFFDLLG